AAGLQRHHAWLEAGEARAASLRRQSGPAAAAPLASVDVCPVRPVARLGLRLVLPRRRPALLARSHYTNLHGAEEQVVEFCVGTGLRPVQAERRSASLCGAGAPPAWLIAVP